MVIPSILNQKKQYTHSVMPETEFPYDSVYFKAGNGEHEFHIYAEIFPYDSVYFKAR